MRYSPQASKAITDASHSQDEAVLAINLRKHKKIKDLCDGKDHKFAIKKLSTGEVIGFDCQHGRELQYQGMLIFYVEPRHPLWPGRKKAVITIEVEGPKFVIDLPPYGGFSEDDPPVEFLRGWIANDPDYIDRLINKQDLKVWSDRPHDVVFVFGSNMAGRHGKGAALYAKLHYGAIEGQAEGRMGDSYAIPTKAINVHTPLSLKIIESKVKKFARYARKNPDEIFYFTPIGCGLAGHSPHDIACIYRRARMPHNVHLAPQWFEHLT